MTGAEGIVFALGTAGEAGKAILLAQRADAVAAAGEDFVRASLIALAKTRGPMAPQTPLLDQIKLPADLRKLEGSRLRQVCDELRAENKRLRQELRRAELEREILKKATAYFAKESQ